MALSANSAVKGATRNRALNRLAYAFANEASDITTATTSDIIPMLDADADYELKYADSANVLEMLGVTASAAELNIVDGVTATAAELNAAADVSGRLVDIGDNTTYTLLAANSGKPHIIPDLTATITISTPTEAAGLEFELIYSGVAADAANWVIDTGSDTNFFLGGVLWADTDAGTGAAEVVAFNPDGNSESKLTAVTPDVGTVIKLLCDGTHWIVSGVVASATTPSAADQ